MERAVYRCKCHEETWVGELPPLWTMYDLWPLCAVCGAYAWLVDLAKVTTSKVT